MRYRTCVNVNYNGDQYPAGSMIELGDKDAAELLECGAIEKVNKPFAAKSLNISVQLDKGDDNV